VKETISYILIQGNASEGLKHLVLNAHKNYEILYEDGYKILNDLANILNLNHMHIITYKKLQEVGLIDIYHVWQRGSMKKCKPIHDMKL
jgi:predicted MarR family transcription regulator